MEGEAAAVDVVEPEGVAAREPEAGRLGAVVVEKKAAGGAGAGSVVVAHGRRERQAGVPQRPEHAAIETRPHSRQPLAAQPRLLARHHVAGADHQVGPQRRDQGHAPVHLGDVGGGAVGAVEIADQHQAGAAAERGRQAGGRPG